MVGDAAQPMTPNLGQGGCVALEVMGRSPTGRKLLTETCAKKKIPACKSTNS